MNPILHDFTRHKVFATFFLLSTDEAMGGKSCKVWEYISSFFFFFYSMDSSTAWRPP